MPQPDKPKQICVISITDGRIAMVWQPPLPEGEHVIAKTEVIALGAIMGMAQAASRKGRRATLNAVIEFNNKILDQDEKQLLAFYRDGDATIREALGWAQKEKRRARLHADPS